MFQGFFYAIKLNFFFTPVEMGISQYVFLFAISITLYHSSTRQKAVE